MTYGMMGFTEAVRICLRKYFQFSGRARRSEYWWFVLFTIIISIIAETLDAWLLGGDYMDAYWTPFATIVFVATFIPSLSVGWRRMHDVGKSGFWNLLWVAPLIWSASGAIVLFSSDEEYTVAGVITVIAGVIFTLACIIYVLVLLVTDSEMRPNRYGPSPKHDVIGDGY